MKKTDDVLNVIAIVIVFGISAIAGVTSVIVEELRLRKIFLHHL